MTAREPGTEIYDALILGAGQAAKPLALDLAAAGRRVALVEKKYLGGTCINEGCSPTKTMVASARVAYLARRGADYGVRTGPVTVDMSKVRDRKRGIVESFRGGSERAVAAAEGLDLFMGRASFTGPKTVRVELNDGGIRSLAAETVFLNVGARPSTPVLPGVESVAALDSTSIMELDRVPEHLLVLGGGYIGLEFGQMFRRFGSRVTIVQRGPQLLGREDPDVAEAVAAVLRQDGVTVLLKTKAVRVSGGPGDIRLVVDGAEGERTLAGSHLLVAAGRTPNTEDLNLAATGVAVDRHGFIPVNERLETNVPGIHVLGDAKGGPSFTHISYDDYRIVKANLLDGGTATTLGRIVPYTVFIDPQLGRVGLNETEAREQGRDIRVARMPMNYVARALEMDESRGFMKAIVDAETDRILGFMVLGVEGGEMMSAMQIAMMGDVPYTVLRSAVFAHPTLMESFNNLFARLDD